MKMNKQNKTKSFPGGVKQVSQTPTPGPTGPPAYPSNNYNNNNNSATNITNITCDLNSNGLNNKVANVSDQNENLSSLVPTGSITDIHTDTDNHISDECAGQSKEYDNNNNTHTLTHIYTYNTYNSYNTSNTSIQEQELNNPSPDSNNIKNNNTNNFYNINNNNNHLNQADASAQMSGNNNYNNNMAVSASGNYINGESLSLPNPHFNNANYNYINPNVPLSSDSSLVENDPNKNNLYYFSQSKDSSHSHFFYPQQPNLQTDQEQDYLNHHNNNINHNNYEFNKDSTCSTNNHSTINNPSDDLTKNYININNLDVDDNNSNNHNHSNSNDSSNKPSTNDSRRRSLSEGNKNMNSNINPLSTSILKPNPTSYLNESWNSSSYMGHEENNLKVSPNRKSSSSFPDHSYSSFPSSSDPVTGTGIGIGIGLATGTGTISMAVVKDLDPLLPSTPSASKPKPQETLPRLNDHHSHNTNDNSNSLSLSSSFTSVATNSFLSFFTKKSNKNQSALPPSAHKNNVNINNSKSQSSRSSSHADDERNVNNNINSSFPSLSSGSDSASLKVQNFQKIINDPNSDLEKLKSLAWGGVPDSVRADVWMLLLGYVPANLSRRKNTLDKRFQEFLSYVKEYYEVDHSERNDNDNDILRQIKQDVPRTSPQIAFFKLPLVQKSLERVLYVWAIRHPASGYVQGINDLATPFYLVYTANYLNVHSSSIISDVELGKNLSPQAFDTIESHVFWSLTNLIDSIQDHYTFAQPGIQRMVFKLKELIQRIDAQLYKHLEENHLQFIHFAFRWMNCLLMRELSLELIIRLWDTYLSEEGGFKYFHVYVCAALLLTWKDKLKGMDFQDLVIFLQKLPTDKWSGQDIDTLLAQAFLYKSWFHSSPHHLQ